MIVIDALGKNGASILPDLEGASPTGGQVSSESRPGFGIGPGDIIRHYGEWCAVLGVAHDGLTGITRLSYLAASESGPRAFSMWRGQSYEVRTDCRIDPDTLYRLTRQPAFA